MMKKQKMTKVSSGLFWSFGEQALGQIISTIISIILARLVLPNDYGTIAIVTIFVSICDALVTGGLGSALVQVEDANDLDFDSVWWLNILVAIGLYGMLFVAAIGISDFYDDSELLLIIRVMAIRIIFTSLNSVQQGFVHRNMIFKKSFMSSLTGTIVSGSVGIVLALNGFGVWALIVQYLSKSVVDTCVLGLIIQWKPRLRFSFDSIVKIWRFGIKILLSTLIFTIRDNIRSFVIGKKFTRSDLAYFNQGQKYSSLLVTNFMDPISKVIYPFYSRNQQDRFAIKKYMRLSVKMSSFIYLPIVMGLYCIADTFVRVLLTDRWIDSVFYLRIFCIFYADRTLTANFQKGIMAIGRSGVVLFHEVVTSALTIILVCLAAFKYENLEMISLSYIVLMIVDIIIYGVAVSLFLKYRFIEVFKDLRLIIFMTGIMCLVVSCIQRLPIVPIILLVLEITGGAFIFIFLAFILKCDSLFMILKFIKERKIEKEKVDE